MTQGTGPLTDRDRLSRRQYAQLLAGGSVASLAGCLGVLEDAEDEQNGPGAPDEPGRDELRLVVPNTRGEANINEFAETENNAGFEYLMELAAPVSAESSDRVLSGTSFEADWIDGTDRISVPAMLSDYDVEPPYDVYETYDSRLTYWDGTPIDAEARLAHQKLYFFQGNEGQNKFDDSATFSHETVDQWRYHHWTGTEEAEGEAADRRSEEVLESEVYGLEFVPLHPDFTQPYRERYEDATTQAAVQEITEELADERIGFERLARNGWGSGLYEIESADDVDDEGFVATARESHPIDHAGVERLSVSFGSQNQEALAAERGQVDLGEGVVGDRGRINQDATPDHVQQIDRSRSDSGDKLLFDMQDHHLQRLWVRRAIVAVVDWRQVTNLAWGEAGSQLVQHDTGLHDTVSRETYDRAFLDSLYQYPREYDVETAIDWLERAGYEGSREAGWTSPEGEPLQLTITAAEDNDVYVRACQVIEANLLSLGVDADVELVQISPGYESKLDSQGGLDFQIALFWDSFTEPWEYFWTEGGWWSYPLLSAESEDHPWYVREQDPPEHDTVGLPLEPAVPTDVGSIDAPNEAGRSPDLDDGETVALPSTVYDLRRPESEEGLFQQYFRECARVYNYYLPQFRFHDYNLGGTSGTSSSPSAAPNSTACPTPRRSSPAPASHSPPTTSTIRIPIGGERRRLADRCRRSGGRR